MGADRRVAVAHQRAQRGRRGVEDVDLVALDTAQKRSDAGKVGTPSNITTVAPADSGP